MEILTVDAASKQYPIYIGADFTQLAAAFEKAGLTGRKAIIITDSNVAQIYLPEIKELLRASFTTLTEIVFAAGEENKNLDTVQSFYKGFVEAGLDRKSVVIALGGGVTGDMAGYAAATFMRGIACVQIPTTLLSQVDSSVGGKTGVDFMNIKNIVGAFYQPEFVYINVATLRKLPGEHIISGMGEVIKHGIIKNKSYFDFIWENRQKINALDLPTLQKIVLGSCEIKSEVVSMDERESGLRELLNYGHTFGHAVEALTEFTIPHGQCVGLGMICALHYSRRNNGISHEEMQKCLDMLQSFGFPMEIPAPYGNLAPETIYQYMFTDKKTKNNVITLVVAVSIGKAVRTDGAQKEDIISAIEFITKRG